MCFYAPDYAGQARSHFLQNKADADALLMYRSLECRRWWTRGPPAACSAACSTQQTRHDPEPTCATKPAAARSPGTLYRSRRQTRRQKIHLQGRLSGTIFVVAYLLICIDPFIKRLTGYIMSRSSSGIVTVTVRGTVLSCGCSVITPILSTMESSGLFLLGSIVVFFLTVITL